MDYSNSMEEYVDGQRKYKTMRDEAVKLVQNLSQNYTNPDVQFGLAPFSKGNFAGKASALHSSQIG
jgi:hypothetical protein